MSASNQKAGLKDTIYKEICFFCYDEFTQEAPRVTEYPIGCLCRFPIHEECWEKWDIFECPICHSRIEGGEEEEEEEEEGEGEEQEEGEGEEEEEHWADRIQDGQEQQAILYRRDNIHNNIFSIQLIFCAMIIWYFQYLLGI